MNDKTLLRLTGVYFCEHCQRPAPMELRSYGQPTKWESVEHGIEGICAVCGMNNVLEEGETNY